MQNIKLQFVLIVLFLAFFAGSITSKAQDTTGTNFEELPESISLSEAIQIALANNTEIKRALLSIEDADQDVRTAWSNVLPEVSSSINYTRNLEVPVNFIPEVVFNPEGDPEKLVPVAFGTDNNWQGGFSVSQTLFNGQAFVGISTSSLFKTAQTEGFRATAQGIVTETRVAFYEVLIAREQRRLQESRLERVQENLEDTQKRYEQGLVDEYAVMQLEVQQENIKPELTSAEYDEKEALRDLLDAMGLPVRLDISVKGDLSSFDIQAEHANSEENQSIKEVDRTTPLTLETDSTFLEHAYGNRGDLRILDVQQQLQDKRIRAEKSQYLPSLVANYDLQWSASQSGNPVFFGNEQERARSQTFMLSLQLPIFQGFRRDAAIQQAQIEKKDLQLQEYQSRQDAQKEITGAEEQIREAFENAVARKRALEQARRGYDRAVKRYQNGLGSQEEVNDAELQLREAEVGYSQMVFGYLSAKAQYDQAIGLVPFIEEQGAESIEEDLEENIELN